MATTPKKKTQAQGTPEAATPASQWKKPAVGGTLLSVPSGNTALVKRVKMEVFLSLGMIPNALIPLVAQAMQSGTVPKEEEVAQDLIKDPKNLAQVVEMVDNVTVFCCIDPKVEKAPKDGHEVIPIGDPRRDENLLYVDEVDFNDKMAIFNFAVGGSADLAPFRTE